MLVGFIAVFAALRPLFALGYRFIAQKLNKVKRL